MLVCERTLDTVLIIPETVVVVVLAALPVPFIIMGRSIAHFGIDGVDDGGIRVQKFPTEIVQSLGGEVARVKDEQLVLDDSRSATPPMTRKGRQETKRNGECIMTY